MKQLPAKADSDQIPSAIHLEFIRSVVDSKNETGVEEVEAFHRAVFLHQHGTELEHAQQERRIREDRVALLDSRMKQLQAKLETEDPLVPVLEDGRTDLQPSAPWNNWDRTMFTVAALGILCLLVFGVFNVSFNLLESGIITFADHPVRAYFWAALLPVGALGVKVGWDFLQSRRKRTLYLWMCLISGIGAVLAWVTAYANVYPTLTKTSEDYVQSLSVFDNGNQEGNSLTRLTSGGVRRIDMILVASQALAEICLSAVLGMYMTQLYAKHRPVRLAPNPAFTQVEAERRELEEVVAIERRALAGARGDETRLENQLTVFVAYAKSLFQKEVTLRRDRGHQKRLLIEEIAEQLRTRLEAVDRADADGDAGNNGELRTLAFDRDRTR